MESIFLELQKYKKLSEDWDGYNATKPKKKIINTLIKFLKKLEMLSVIPPKPMIAGSGEVGAYWENEQVYIEITVDEVSKYDYFIKFNENYNLKHIIKEVKNLEIDLLLLNTLKEHFEI